MAIQEGWSLYHAIRAAACDRPFRLVVWSWPSERIQGGLRHDAQVKAARSDVQAHYLALCLDRMSPDVPVNLVGHSFGARTILGAMELLAGGTVAGRVTTHDANRPRGPIRAVLIAAAVENGCLLPGHRDGLALGQLERVLITCNVKRSGVEMVPAVIRPRRRGGAGLHGPGLPFAARRPAREGRDAESRLLGRLARLDGLPAVVRIAVASGVVHVRVGRAGTRSGGEVVVRCRWSVVACRWLAPVLTTCWRSSAHSRPGLAQVSPLERARPPRSCSTPGWTFAPARACLSGFFSGSGLASRFLLRRRRRLRLLLRLRLRFRFLLRRGRCLRLLLRLRLASGFCSGVAASRASSPAPAWFPVSSPALAASPASSPAPACASGFCSVLAVSRASFPAPALPPVSARRWRRLRLLLRLRLRLPVSARALAASPASSPAPAWLPVSARALAASRASSPAPARRFRFLLRRWRRLGLLFRLRLASGFCSGAGGVSGFFSGSGLLPVSAPALAASRASSPGCRRVGSSGCASGFFSGAGGVSGFFSGGPPGFVSGCFSARVSSAASGGWRRPDMRSYISRIRALAGTQYVSVRPPRATFMPTTLPSRATSGLPQSVGRSTVSCCRTTGKSSCRPLMPTPDALSMSRCCVPG